MFRCFFDSIDSTNTHAKQLIRTQNLPDEFSIIANSQTSGVGKRGVVWQSPVGNLYISIVLKIDKYFRMQDVGLISLLTSNAVRETISCYCAEQQGNLQILSKWVNDIIVVEDNNNIGSKVSGILLEIESSPQKEDYLIIGIAVNLVHAPKLSKYNTTSLLDITSQKISNIAFADNLENNFFANLQEFTTDNASVVKKFKNNLFNFKKEITVKLGDTIKTGILNDITQEGYLVLEVGSNLEIITAGEVFGFEAPVIPA
ncbi:MAG: biotin--[acetyl-CoA-carboxylase] ligase [Alphaproteobacteria bacterium]|jgi:BirA family biotin operon repressor/biotin-[acetyl-CoA-carboxylase] ligase|nr:biotin--[acetyl-CoA-carboxylase] ligase [Alphaproteobacteria bacterium]